MKRTLVNGPFCGSEVSWEDEIVITPYSIYYAVYKLNGSKYYFDRFLKETEMKTVDVDIQVNHDWNWWKLKENK